MTRLLVWRTSDKDWCPNCQAHPVTWTGKGADVCGCCRVEYTSPTTNNKCRNRHKP